MDGYIVGLDGGGSKTAMEVLLSDGSRRRETFGPLNPNGLPIQQVQETFLALFSYLGALPDGLSGCRYLCIASAGITNPDTALFFKEEAARCGFTGKLLLQGDHDAALAGALSGGDGMILVAGTGSIAFGRAGEKTHRTGGGGHLIDDEGSGYAIGRDILAHLLRTLDQREGATALSALVEREMGISSSGEIIQFVYDPATGKKQIAALARLLPVALAVGDATAIEIANKAARELAALVLPIAKALDLPKGPLVLCGSIVTKDAFINAALMDILKKALPQLEVQKPISDAAGGAVLLAQKAI